MLLVTAGLFIRSFARLGAVALGFDSDRVLVVDINASRAPVNEKNRASFFQGLADAVRAVPGRGLRSRLPQHAGQSRADGHIRFHRIRRRGTPANERQRVIVNLVTPGWFETYGMAVRAGRVIDRRDTASAARRGRQRGICTKVLPRPRSSRADRLQRAARIRSPPVHLNIIGVVENTVDQSLRADAFPTLYQPLAQFTMPIPLLDVSLSVRADVRFTRLAGPQRVLRSHRRRSQPRLQLSIPSQIRSAPPASRNAWWPGSRGSSGARSDAGRDRPAWRDVVHRRTPTDRDRYPYGPRRSATGVVDIAVRQTIVMTICGVVAGLARLPQLTRYLQTLSSASRLSIP